MEIMKYLYIDDEYNENKTNNVQPIADRLTLSKKILVDLHKIDSFENILIELNSILNNYDGIILDLQLNDKPNDAGIRFPTNAPTLAQHLRNEFSEGKIKSIPIILCSTDNKIKTLYTNDLTSHDLFDMRFAKEIFKGNQQEKENRWTNNINKLYSLADGYKLLIGYCNKLDEILGLDIKALDSRMFSRFEEQNVPIHEYARFLLKEFIYTPGALVDEQLLAARLGLDINKSSDWGNLINTHFKDAKYKGVFSSGWNRWWMHLVNQEFRKITNTSIQYIDARERVRLLKEETKLNNLQYAEKILMCKSYRYWTVCKGNKTPLDPREGYKVNSIIEPKPWQEYEYVSLHAMLERMFDPDSEIKIHPSDKERFLLDKKNI